MQRLLAVRKRLPLRRNQPKQPVVSLYNNGELIEQKSGEHIFTFQLPMEKENQIEAVAGSVKDAMVLCHTEKENPDYKLKKEAKKSENWV